MSSADKNDYLKIGDVARLIDMSPTVIRMWESLGLARPRRTKSKYRLYSRDDVRLLKRASFLRKVRGMNASAIVHMLKRDGHVHPRDSGQPVMIGALLRRLRLKKDVPLTVVAEAVGISVGFLSALERSQMNASVGTLRKLARFYGNSVLDFFQTSQTNPHLVRPQDRKKLSADRGVVMELLAWGNTVMEPHLFRIAPGAGSEGSYSHHGEEFLHVLQGNLNISIAGEHYTLKPGDSLYFDSDAQHEWHNPGKRETVVIWINTPPTF
ncbi:MAG TPA: cupin domain-containing protein [Terriglobales bacterium]|nr:cupin domain-containing protein [Terriglobales bacterium]